MVTADLVAFIHARIAEDEMVAARAIDRHSIAHDWAVRDSEDAEYFSRWNPWRILNLCIIRRRVVAVHRPVRSPAGLAECVACSAHIGQAGWPCLTIRLLVLDWVEHPDFQEHWGWVPDHRRPSSR